ncbi:4-alpha-glucanotransferase [Nakamurella sp. YIM 132084]|uniref:4-alpha-glucanotransferase n=1 Tax=Nakamurella leprariae TaxID=2803911 RepID=A0A938YCV4_9ACTN|nr:4-alpha-glucanotransferase [Nakamurella leprariae]
MLRELADSCGVSVEYQDQRQRRVTVQADTVRTVLGVLGVDASTPERAEQALVTRTAARWARMLPPCLVSRPGRPGSGWVHAAPDVPVTLSIELERGGVITDLAVASGEPASFDGPDGVVLEHTVPLPADLPLGYHRLIAEAGGRRGETTVIVTPDWVGTPERTGARAWGLATQLYSVRSRQSWGTGDLVDLTDLAAWSAAEHGADWVLVNPLHAAQPVPPLTPSPYLPTSRRFASPIYLRPERLPEFAGLSEADRQHVADLAEQARGRDAGVPDGADRPSRRIDRDTAWAAKLAALALVHAVSRSPGRDLAYRAYLRQQGRGLQDFATWSAIAQQHGPDWRQWPEPLQRPDSPAVAAYADQHATLVDLHRWLQWQLDEQLDDTQSAARRAGMSLGVLHDLAVGVDPGGADAWALQDAFAGGVTVGAPPDSYNQAGQDWGQPPWRPDALAELAYAPLRDMVATMLRHAGGLRVDHILGLFRLWWIPEGRPPTEGTYVRYDAEAMLGVLALEASRAGALVVGEDLGTVEPRVQRMLAELGLLGTSILFFERDYAGDGAPLPAETWREYCLATVTTHDLPPTAGYLAGEHIRLRDELGLLTRPVEDERAEGEAERASWVAVLRERGLLPDDREPDSEELVVALHRFLLATPSRLLGVALPDLVGDVRTQNQPGTSDEYPNWRVPLAGPDGRPIWLEEIFTDPRAARLAGLFAG